MKYLLYMWNIKQSLMIVPQLKIKTDGFLKIDPSRVVQLKKKTISSGSASLMNFQAISFQLFYLLVQMQMLSERFHFRAQLCVSMCVLCVYTHIWYLYVLKLIFYFRLSFWVLANHVFLMFSRFLSRVCSTCFPQPLDSYISNKIALDMSPSLSTLPSS